MRCDHKRGNIQQFTEVCLDCGHNIYETDDEYEKSLRQDIAYLRKELQQEKISDLEELKDKLQAELDKKRNKDEDHDW